MGGRNRSGCVSSTCIYTRVSLEAGQEGRDCARQTGHLSQKRGDRGAAGGEKSAKKLR